MREPKEITHVNLKPQAADLSLFKKQLASRFRHQMAAILGNIGEKVASDYLETQGYIVCKIDDHRMMGTLYNPEIERARLKEQKPSLDRVISRGYRIPTIDLHARWEDLGLYLRVVGDDYHRFCEHIPTVLAVKIYECYCRYRGSREHHFQFPDFLGHKDGKHYVIEVKTNKGRVSKKQFEFMHLLGKLGLDNMVIHVDIDRAFFFNMALNLDSL